MKSVLLTPPVVFAIVFIFGAILSCVVSKLSFKNENKEEGAGKSYACGEDVSDHMAQPDYSQFFPFAFFFTLAHVATMMVTSIPLGSINTLIIAELYIVVVFIALFVLLKR